MRVLFLGLFACCALVTVSDSPTVLDYRDHPDFQADPPTIQTVLVTPAPFDVAPAAPFYQVPVLFELPAQGVRASGSSGASASVNGAQHLVFQPPRARSHATEPSAPLRVPGEPSRSGARTRWRT